MKIQNKTSFARNKIQVTKEEAFEKVGEWEMINQKLKSELKDTTQQLITKSNELSSSKVELQKHRQEIDVSYRKRKKKLLLWGEFLGLVTSFLNGSNCEDKFMNLKKKKVT